ncbi:hypothetical protein JOB18_046409 [Solea senegalensis]|uniref:Uncharacterized protein n=1 Tax=Solea senegalensis TaxID=28829 RepID=A0AAV6RFZ8_SOLSE|nr:hypothetical protein JOB18_046409 [Solea senegalensis]
MVYARIIHTLIEALRFKRRSCRHVVSTEVDDPSDKCTLCLDSELPCLSEHTRRCRRSPASTTAKSDIFSYSLTSVCARVCTPRSKSVISVLLDKDRMKLSFNNLLLKLQVELCCRTGLHAFLIALRLQTCEKAALKRLCPDFENMPTPKQKKRCAAAASK